MNTELLKDYVDFPNPELAQEGLLCMGGDLGIPILISAYRQGIFPWFNEDEPILWWSPDPRCVVKPGEVKISKSMRQFLKRHNYTIKIDNDFETTIKKCQSTPRKGEDGTWITADIINAYCQLFNLGIAHSFEVYENDEMIGGLYGVSMGKMFFGESMFSEKSNSSKLAFIFLSEFLKHEKFSLIDCQVPNPHLLSMGCVEMDRKEFLSINKLGIQFETSFGSWEQLGNNFLLNTNNLTKL